MDSLHRLLDAEIGEGEYKRTNKGAQFAYSCPFCNDYKPRMFIHYGRQAFYCHNCGEKGTLISFLSKYYGYSWQKALLLYRDHEGYEKPLPDNVEEEIYDRLLNIDTRANRIIHPLPDEYIPIKEAHGRAGRRALEYLYNRGVPSSQAVKNNIGYCEEGHYKDRLILPDYENGELIFWQARTWKPQPEDKYKRKYYRKVLNPSLSEEEKGRGALAIEKSEVISNIDTILEKGSIVICEGRFDAYTIGDLGGCIHGKYMSDTQIMKLISNKDKIKDIVIMLDPDAMDLAITLGSRLYKHFDNIRICRLPDGTDPNDLGRKRVAKAIREAEQYDDLFLIRAKLKNWL